MMGLDGSRKSETLSQRELPRQLACLLSYPGPGESSLLNLNICCAPLTVFRISHRRPVSIPSSTLTLQWITSQEPGAE